MKQGTKKAIKLNVIRYGLHDGFRDESSLESDTHKRLCVTVPVLETDYSVYGGGVERWSEDIPYPDCSCGCKWAAWLEGRSDWCVCTNPASPRRGLLTFEHQAGHKCYERDAVKELRADRGKWRLKPAPVTLRDVQRNALETAPDPGTGRWWEADCSGSDISRYDVNLCGPGDTVFGWISLSARGWVARMPRNEYQAGDAEDDPRAAMQKLLDALDAP